MNIKVDKLKKPRGRRSFTRQEKIILPIFHSILIISAVWEMLPIFMALINSVKPLDSYYASPLGFPTVFQFSNYVNALKVTYRNKTVLQMLFNSAIFVTTFTFATMASSICTAYILSKFKFIGRRFIYGLAIGIQVIPIFGNQTSAYMFCDSIGLVDRKSVV